MVDILDTDTDAAPVGAVAERSGADSRVYGNTTVNGVGPLLNGPPLTITSPSPVIVLRAV